MRRTKVHFRLVQDEDGYPPVGGESVWARGPVSANQYILDNVPFFARDATLGDTVAVRLEEGQAWFDALVTPSSSSLLRVTFFDPSSFGRVERALTSFGCLTEHLPSHNLLAVSAPGPDATRAALDLLAAELELGTIDYEEAIVRLSPCPAFRGATPSAGIPPRVVGPRDSAKAPSARLAERAQRLVCARFGAGFHPTAPGAKVGIARDLRDAGAPLHGLRQAPAAGTSGWFIWAGLDFSLDDDFFLPLHVEHLASWCPAALPYLGLPPGYRFLLADGHEDVWEDASLLVAP